MTPDTPADGEALAEAIAEAVAYVRQAEPVDEPWRASTFGHGPLPNAIATILNAVLSGALIPRPAVPAQAAQVEAIATYPHPGYGKPYPITTVLRDLASQEGCDGEPYDAMMFAAKTIDDMCADRNALVRSTLERAARVAKHRHEVWAAGDGFWDADGLPAVECDVTACDNIADAILALRTALIPRPAEPAPAEQVRTFYIDCEFDGHAGPLLSIAMVRGDGRGLHVKVSDLVVEDPWVAENVLPIMDSHHADYSWNALPNEVGTFLRGFIGACQNPTIIADSPVDIARFCRAISTGEDGGWHSTGYEGMTFIVRNVDCYPTALTGAVQHNAWWDAMALRAALQHKDDTHGPE